MPKQTKLLRLCGVGLSLWLLAIPTAAVWGQDAATDSAPTDGARIDGVGEPVESVEVPDASGGAASPDSQEIVELDPELLTNRVFLPMIQRGDQTESVVETTEVEAANFLHPWVATCVNVLDSERGLLDDIPGGDSSVYDNESGLFWLITNQALDESCSYLSTFTGQPTGPSGVKVLQIAAAVSDGASLIVTVYRNVKLTLGTFCGPWLALKPIHSNSFYLVGLDIPSGSTVCAVSINLDDNPNTLASGHVSAVINYIKLTNDKGDAIFWQEEF